jgi:cell division protease FtsH
MGPARTGKVMSEQEKKITAYHEGGHALVGTVMPEADPVNKVTILSRGRAGGYTMNMPTEDRNYHTRSGFLDQIAMMLGGYTAEKIVFNEITTGGSSDLDKATKLARSLVTQYGMSDSIGPVVLGESHQNVFLGRDIGEQRNYSDAIAEKIDSEVRRILVDAEQRAAEAINTHRSYLDKIAEKLLTDETLEQDEFNEIVKDIIPEGKKKIPEFEDAPAEAGQ